MLIVPDKNLFFQNTKTLDLHTSPCSICSALCSILSVQIVQHPTVTVSMEWIYIILPDDWFWKKIVEGLLLTTFISITLFQLTGNSKFWLSFRRLKICRSRESHHAQVSSPYTAFYGEPRQRWEKAVTARIKLISRTFNCSVDCAVDRISLILPMKRFKEPKYVSCILVEKFTIYNIMPDGAVFLLCSGHPSEKKKYTLYSMFVS